MNLGIINNIRDYHDRRVEKAVKKFSQFDGIHFLDIGAAGDVDPRWKAIKRYINYYGFEPDVRSIKTLMENKNEFKTYQIFPQAVWDKNDNLNFNLTNKPEVSSFFEPNKELLLKFPDYKRFEIKSVNSLSTTKIDDIKLSEVDFMKIDVQGGELNVLNGATNTMNRVFGLEVEIEFLQIYKGQPLFGEINDWLFKRNFEFIEFLKLYRWERHQLKGYGQCVFADALFLKMPEYINFNLLSDEKIKSYLSILLLYKRFDLIDKSFEMFSNDKRNLLSGFIDEVENVRKWDKYVRNLNSYSNKLFSIFGRNYSSHLLH